MPDKKLTEPVGNSNRLTVAEVKKALEESISFDEPYESDFTLIRIEYIKDALDLINRQEFRIHQQEKTIMEIQNANLIDFKATIGNYIAENESLIAEIERLWLCIDELKKLVGKHEPNYDPSKEVDTIVQRITISDAPSLQAKIKAEAYKEFLPLLEKFRDEVVDKFIIMCDGNDYNKLNLMSMVDTIDCIYDKHIDNLLNEFVGDEDGKRKD